jgi:acetylornithine deacetylase/succinyl-diaminopimelate desuccinylase-like protein
MQICISNLKGGNMSLGRIQSYIKDNENRFIQELQEVARQPSISAQDVGVKVCARLFEQVLAKRGFQVQYLEAGGQPALFARRQGKEGKALLFYNHYDVQPPEPLDLWDSPPFSAEIRNGKMFGRGVSDHKGSLMARIHAIEAIVASEGELPITIKFILDGEEESGSPTLWTILDKNRELLKADAALWSGGAKDEEDRPTLRCGNKGVCKVRLSAETANQDLHSRWAPIVQSAAWRLVNALNVLKNDQEKILIKGFYDHIEPLTPEDETALKKFPFASDILKKNFGVSSLIDSLEGTEALKRNLFGPTCNIAGMVSGYTGMGSKTVLPCNAWARMDMRLVPNQKPLDILEKVKRHLLVNGFADIKVELLSTSIPSRTSLQSHIVKQVAESVTRVYGQEPVLHPISGGVGSRYLIEAKEYLGIPMVADTGVSYADSRHHSPNENIRIADYMQGVMHMADLIKHF